MGYRPDLDGLRAIAVLLVLIFHFELFDIGAGGFIGVDMFFVLSGFLIATISWQQLEEGKFELGGFYLRRLRRLAPAIFVVQTFVLAFAYLRALPDQMESIAWQSLSTQTYSINFYLRKNMNYFGVQADSVPLLHCWSLAIEEQFYLFFPLLLVAIHRYRPSSRWTVLGLLAAASFALNLLLVTRKPEATFYLLPTRAWELLLGAMTGALIPAFSKRAGLRQGAAILGCVFIAAGLVLYHRGIPFPGTFALLPCLGAVSLICAGAGKGSFLSPIVESPLAVQIGRISYSLYLVHWPLRVLGASEARDFDATWRWSLFAASFALAALLYWAVEDPIRRKRFIVGTRPFVGAYVGSAAAIVLLSVASFRTGGFRFRFSPEVLKIADHVRDRDESRKRCEVKHGAEKPCFLGKQEAEPTWLVVGDSHAWALAEAISLALDQRGSSGYLTFSHGCLPVSGLGKESCRRLNGGAIEFLEEHPELERVLLVSIWRQVVEGGLEGPDGEFVAKAQLPSVFQEQFRKTLDMFHGMGRKVYIWEPLPSARDNVPVALARERAFGISPELDRLLSEHRSTFSFMTDALSRNRTLIAGVISPVAAMCDGSKCVFERDGAPIFSDTNHPAKSASRFFAEIISAQIPH